MKKIAIIACLMIAKWGTAQKEKALNYINAYKEIAIAEMQRSGVPASITLAQGILESAYGESDLCKQSNNHFGIKCKTEWTGEKVYHDDDTRQECFRSYPNAADSYKDHSNFLRTRSHYDFLFQLDPKDYEGWAKGLKKAGYATEKDYPQKLMKVIGDYNLNQYTLTALNKRPVDNETLAVATDVKDTMLGELIISFPAKKVQQKQVVAVGEHEEDSVIIINAAVAKSTATDPKKNSYPEGIFAINHSKVIFAKEGTSLLALAKQYDISLTKLLDFNDMQDEDVLSANKLIFIEKKLTKGAVDFHVVQAKESLHDICQSEGVRLDKIAEYNNIKRDVLPLFGEKIYLRGIAPVPPKTHTASILEANTLSAN